MIAGYGMLAFRDPYGIRPLVVGANEAMGGTEYLVASESVALEPLGFSVLRDIAPGEAIFVGQAGDFHSRQCAENPSLNPCIFEYVYLARPDSVMWMIVREGGVMLAGGIAVGLLLAIGAGKVLSGMLYQVSAFDPILSSISLTFLPAALLDTAVPIGAALTHRTNWPAERERCLSQEKLPCAGRPPA